MKVLFDTHALLWFHAQDARLSDRTRTTIESGTHECWYSIISLWEIAIKIGTARWIGGNVQGHGTVEPSTTGPEQGACAGACNSAFISS